MPARYIVSETAQADIEQIIDYIASDNVDAALALEDDIYEAFNRLAENPLAGFQRPDWTKRPYRFWVLRKRYLVVYSEGPPVGIARVLSGYQDSISQLDVGN